MRIRPGPARVGRRVGGFYASGQVTGRHAGRRYRIGHDLLGGLYGTIPIHLDRTPHRAAPQRPAAVALGRGFAVAVYALLAGLCVAAGAWPLGVILGCVVIRQTHLWATAGPRIP